jgi:predicted nucleic acid-binding protein
LAAVSLETAIPPGASLLVDSSAALAYLAGSEPASPFADQVFDAFVATGRNPAALSMVTVEEILVRPFRSGTAAVATAEGFLRHFAEIRLVEVSYDIAREAARIRAATGMRTPDALIIATALIAEVDILVTNDRSWRSAAEAIAPSLGICLLSDLARTVG